VRLAVLTQGKTGYLDASLRALHDRGHDIFVAAPSANDNVAFARLDMDAFAECMLFPRNAPPDPIALVSTLHRFAPDVVIMVSWSKPHAFRAAMKARGDNALGVLLMDNVWRNTAKQWLGRAGHRVYLDPVFDCVMVPSDRTEFFARRLGFAPNDVIRGCWSADLTRFGADPCSGETLAARKRFLSVGRLVHHKGADILAAAYRVYRSAVTDPWDLVVAGDGPLAGCFDGLAGVTMVGFKQPAEVADLMRGASCFVLPSREEPYGVVVHEAAASSLPLLCTDFCGATPMFVQDGYNGWVVTGGSVDALVDGLIRMSASPAERLEEMSAISKALSSRLSPHGWAQNVEEEFTRRLARRRHDATK